MTICHQRFEPGCWAILCESNHYSMLDNAGVWLTERVNDQWHNSVNLHLSKIQKRPKADQLLDSAMSMTYCINELSHQIEAMRAACKRGLVMGLPGNETMPQQTD